MMAAEDQTETIDFLTRRETHDGAATTRIDTHGAVVVLAGRRAFKLKRAVRFPYMDFSTSELRRQMCEAEIRLNRRTAPALYLGVMPILASAVGGLRFGTLGDTAPAGAVDYVVVMRRFDSRSQFDDMASRGALDVALMPDLAEIIARFHAEAERRPQHGGSAATERIAADQMANLHAARRFGASDLAKLKARWDEAIARHGALLDRRAEGGFVRHCHGDLHLRNICLVDGRPVIFDAIEFSEPIACIDIMYDLAFLVMDLVHRGLGGHAWSVFNRYIAVTQDIDGLALLPLYQSFRAAIRAHVSLSMAGVQAQVEAQGGARPCGADAYALEAEAEAYMALALRLADPPPARLVAIGGLSGTGKSTLARRLAPRIGAPPGALLLRSDEIRKNLMGVGLAVRLGPEGYSEAMTNRVYVAMRDRARAALAAGASVIADAVHARPSEREAIAFVAEAIGVRFDGVWLSAPGAVLESRVARRKGDASDADVAVVQTQLGYELGAIQWQRLDAGAAIDELGVAAEAHLGIS